MGAGDQDLSQLLQAMFRHDERGRLTGDAPLGHILRIADAVECRLHATMPDATTVRVHALAAAPRGRPGAWARLVQTRGAKPFHPTTFDNLASLNVARRLGLGQVRTDFSIYGAVAPPPGSPGLNLV